MTVSSFYTDSELEKIGFKACGKNVKISRKTSIYSPSSIEIGNDVRIDDFCILSGSIVLKDFIHISAYSAMYGRFGIIMDSYSGISPRCTIFSASDDFSGHFMIGPMVSDEFTNVTGDEVHIKQYVQIGANSIVFPGVKIEEGSAVGAMSLVIKDLEAWGIYAGIPAKRIKDRKKDLLILEKKFREFLNNK